MYNTTEFEDVFTLTVTIEEVDEGADLAWLHITVQVCVHVPNDVSDHFGGFCLLVVVVDAVVHVLTVKHVYEYNNPSL